MVPRRQFVPPTPPFNRYVEGLPTGDPTATLHIIAPNYLPSALQAEDHWPPPKNENLRWMPAPENSWQGQVMYGPAPRKEIYIANGALRRVVEREPHKVRQQLGFLVGLATQRAHTRVWLCKPNELPHPGLALLTRERDGKLEAADDPWVVNKFGLLRPDASPKAASDSLETVRSLRQNPPGISHTVTAHILDWAQAGWAIRKGATDRFLAGLDLV